MKEDFIHYLWRYSLYKNRSLKLTNGTIIEVINCGSHNYNSGPDFFNAKIKIGDTIWVGNVEIHILASDWFKHNHHKDRAYDNVILHVVLKNDMDVLRENGDIIPVVELEIPSELQEQYSYLMTSKSWVPCESFINSIDDFTIFQWKEALGVERLQDKSRVIEERYLSNNKNWEETFYQTLAANFGFKTNAQPFEMLAKSLPISFLGKHKNQLSLIESMIFGQAGLIPENPSDIYSVQLLKDYNHLKNKFNLQPLDEYIWKYSRLRPPNFPTIRLAQFASLIYKSNSLLSKIIEADNFTQVRQLFDISVSEYWSTHYVFDKESVKKDKQFGENAFQNIVINTIAPFFMLMASVKNQPEFADKALDWLLQIKAEDNNIIRHWSQLGLAVDNALDTQALIQLKNLYCNHRKCLNCRIGNQVILHTV